MHSFFKNNQDYVYAIARIVFGALFFLHGSMKFGALGGKAASVFTLMWFGGVIEVVVGLMLVLGFFTTWFGILGSGEMAVAYWMMHATSATWWNPLANKGEAAVLFCFGLLLFAFYGSRKWSLAHALFPDSKYY